MLSDLVKENEEKLVQLNAKLELRDRRIADLSHIGDALRLELHDRDVLIIALREELQEKGLSLASNHALQERQNELLLTMQTSQKELLHTMNSLQANTKELMKSNGVIQAASRKSETASLSVATKQVPVNQIVYFTGKITTPNPPEPHRALKIVQGQQNKLTIIMTVENIEYLRGRTGDIIEPPTECHMCLTPHSPTGAWGESGLIMVKSTDAERFQCTFNDEKSAWDLRALGGWTKSGNTGNFEGADYTEFVLRDAFTVEAKDSNSTAARSTPPTMLEDLSFLLQWENASPSITTRGYSFGDRVVFVTKGADDGGGLGIMDIPLQSQTMAVGVNRTAQVAKRSRG